VSNFASVFKDHVIRLARQQARKEVAKLKKASAQHRRDLAALKRVIANLQKQVKNAGAPVQAGAAESQPEALENVRFSARSVKAQRQKLGLSAKDFGKLVGVTALAIYNWEQGKSRPRAHHLANFVAIRGIGRREAYQRLGLNDAKAEDKIQQEHV
jgi:DNA-binding transcriptional regulator YiaG